MLPQASRLHLEPWQIDTPTAPLTLRVPSTQALVPCAVCRVPTRRIHSREGRTGADLPWAQWRVVLHRQVRKFCCAKGRCTRRLCAERRPGVVAPWARRTVRLLAWLAQIAVALGGAAGVQLRRGLGVAVSRRTLLRVLRRRPTPSFVRPTGLGVDDFARRTRQRSSTVLLDLERHRPVALLPDRPAETLAPWLQEHPGVEVIARDRSQAYADGAHQGAPTAVQVADRVHLLPHLAEALEQVFTPHRQPRDAVKAALRQQPGPVSDGAVAGPVPSTDSPPPAPQGAAPRQARRQRVDDQVWAWHRQGGTVAALAQPVGSSPRTVPRALQTATLLGRQRRRDRGRSLLHPSQAVLRERWNAGCHTAMPRFRDLQRRGYAGREGLVAADARRLRQAQGLAPGHRRVRQPLPVVAEARSQPLPPRRATGLVLRRAAQRPAAEAAQLAPLRAQQAEVADASALAQDCAALVRPRQPERLAPWLKRATTRAWQAGQRFAKGRYQDDAAVNAGGPLPWSTGPVEGQINRRKMLKRQMCGRAKRDLLSRRFLRTPGGAQAGAHPGAMAA